MNYTDEQLMLIGRETPFINTNPLPKYCLSDQDYGMTIGIAITHKGRKFICWVGGGDNSKAYFLLAYANTGSDEIGEPCLVIDPHESALPYDRCTIVGNVWIDPMNRLWLFFNQTLQHFDGYSSNWFIRCDNPDAEELVWTDPQYIYYGCTLNKPVILTSGEWMLPISVWARHHISDPFKEKCHDIDDIRMAHVFTSSNNGTDWNRRGGVVFPDSRFDEHMFVELKDKRIWMLARTKEKRLWESYSIDRGATWSNPVPSAISSVSARFNLRKLKSGNILLVKHGASINTAPENRSMLYAFLSNDDGRTWSNGLLIDERFEVSYPDSDEDSNGNIYITYDRNRAINGEILMARITESDLLAGKLITQGSFIKKIIVKPGKLLH